MRAPRPRPARRRAAALARVGAIIEEPRFHRHLTGRENLHVHAAARDKRRARAGRRRARARRPRPPRRRPRAARYSLGMRQRLGVARCLLCDPELLSSTSRSTGSTRPASSSSAGSCARSSPRAARCWLSSHLLDEVEKTCDVAAIVDSGRVVAQGTIAELTGGGARAIDIVAAPPRARRRRCSPACPTSPARPSTTARSASSSRRRRRPTARSSPRCCAGCSTDGIAVERVPPVASSLEDRFLDMTTRLEDRSDARPALIRAEILKLRRRPGMLRRWRPGLRERRGVFAVLAVLHAARPVRSCRRGRRRHFDDAVGVLAMAAPVAGVLVGATAGGADIEAGVFRDLVATGRSRTRAVLRPRARRVGRRRARRSLAAWRSRAARRRCPARRRADAQRHRLAAAPQVLVAGALTAAVCVGLAALTGSRGTVIGVALAFQLGVSPLLGQLEALGDARFAIPQVAVARHRRRARREFALAAAIAIVLAWAAVALAAGALAHADAGDLRLAPCHARRVAATRAPPRTRRRAGRAARGDARPARARSRSSRSSRSTASRSTGRCAAAAGGGGRRGGRADGRRPAVGRTRRLAAGGRHRAARAIAVVRSAWAVGERRAAGARERELLAERGGGRRAAADRPRAARRGRPRRLADGRAGAGARRDERRRARARGDRRDRRPRPADDGRDAPHAAGPARRRRAARAAAGPRRRSTSCSTARAPPACRCTLAVEGAPRELAPALDAVGVPDRPGGGDERRPPRRRRARRRSRVRYGADALELVVADEGERRGRGASAPAATASSGCASAPRCSAARSTRGRATGAASRSARCSRTG